MDMREERTRSYLDEVYKIFHEGGKLWIVERTDTNEFPVRDIGIRHTGRDQPPRRGQKWSKSISFQNLSYAFLKKEDAHPDILNFNEGGCLYCGHGHKVVPVELTEHEFVPNTDKNE